MPSKAGLTGRPGTELIIFDCDGVLIDSEALSARVLIGALDALGIHVDFDYFCVNFVGRSFPTVAQIIRESFNVKLPDDFEQEYRRNLLEEFGKGLSPTPGVVDAIRRLTVRSCVATSSSPQRVHRSLDITGLAAHFGDAVFTASEVRRGKPFPDLFLHVADRMRADPARCLVIEDSLPGVEAAQAAGMQVLRYTGGAHLAGRTLKHDSSVRSFDNWQELFVMMPGLGRMKADNGRKRAAGERKSPAG